MLRKYMSINCRHNRVLYKAEGILCLNCDTYIDSVSDSPITGAPFIADSYNINTVDEKLKHYGVTDPVTGEGVTEHTEVSEGPGMTATKTHN